MPRAKRGTKARSRRKKVLKLAKGAVGPRKNYRQAKTTVEKGLHYAFRDRKVRKREMRSLWIIRINAAARENGITYKNLIAGLEKAMIQIDRKILAALAVEDPKAFGEVAALAKAKMAA